MENLQSGRFHGLAETILGLREGRLDPVALAEEALEGMAKADPAIMIDKLPERARTEALAARQRLADGKRVSPLDGLPTAWKDLFDLAGRVTTAGSVVLKSQPPASADAVIVQAARRAGVVTLGSLNMTEFAYSGIGLNPHYGTPRNACGSGAARVPGGSSSGSAVAVARGLLPFAVGTDTGGSVRVPAAFNGIAGYKASTGRYPMEGVFPLSRTLDSLGPLAHSVTDCSLVDAVLAGKQRPDVEPAPLSAITILVPGNVVFDGCEEAVRNNFEAACERLARSGVRVERMQLSAFDQALETMSQHGSIVGAEALHLHQKRLKDPDGAKLDRRVRKRILSASTTTSSDLLELIEVRARLVAEAAARIGAAFVAFPTVPHVAPEIAPLEADDDVFYRVNAKTLRNTSLGNFLDWCGVSMPDGVGDAGMPTGFLLSAPHGRDDALLSAAMATEAIVRGEA